MTACLLVGGLGTRVSHITRGQPKCYMSVGGHRWIDWVVDHLEKGGIRHVVLAHDPYGTGGAVKAMLGVLPDEGFWVLNGDTWLSHCVYPTVTHPTMLVYPGWGNSWVTNTQVVGYEKGSKGGPYIDCGGWYTPDLWDSTPFMFDMGVIIHKAIKRGLNAHRLVDKPYEVGSPEGIREVEAYLESLH